jgi:ATP/maltotriose-dependent transcriptional regulator MalT
VPARAQAGASAVRTALRYRIALVLAPAGWGKTTAVRAALDGIEHRWVDLSREPAAFDFAAARAPGDPIVVLDGVHLLDEASLAALVESMRAQPAARWLLISRRRSNLPVARWIASDDAGAPVLFEDLALGASDVDAAARELDLHITEPIVATILERTGGWPVAVRFMLSTLERSPDVERATAAARRLLFDYVGTEIFDALSETRRECLFALAMAGTANEAFLEEIGCGDAERDADWLRAGAFPLIETSDGFTLHAAFAQFLLTRPSPAHIEKLALRVAAALRVRGRLADAFDIVRAYAPVAVLDELRAGGFVLLDAGCWASVEATIRALPQAVRRDDPIVVCLRAQLEAQTGALSRAHDLYERAFQIAQSPALRACVSRHRALHLLNQGDAGGLAAIAPALDVGTEAERTDALGIHATALAMTGSIDRARAEIRSALASAKAIDEDYLLARTLQRASYVEFQGGSITAATRYAGESAHLAQRIGAWSPFIGAHSILYGVAGARDDHAAALWHAQQIGIVAERTGDRRHRLYALSAQYELEVERGRIDRALAIEAELPLHPSGWRDETTLYVSLAIRKSWNGSFLEGYRQLAALDDRIVEASERRLWNAALSMLAAFDGDERVANARLRACGKTTAAVARESAVGNAQAECFAAIGQILLGNPEGGLRRVPHRAPTTQTRALATFAREIAALGTTLGRDSAADALARLRAAGQEGFAAAFAAALDVRRPESPSLQLTGAERRVLARVALGTPADAIAREHGRSIHTVRNQIKAAIRKLGASGSIEAVARAKRLRLID